MNCIVGAEVVCEQYSADCSSADVREQQVDPPVLLLDACDLLSWLCPHCKALSVSSSVCAVFGYASSHAINVRQSGCTVHSS